MPYAGAPLAYATPTYWWRARGKNAAGDGAYATPVSFTLDASGNQGDQLDQWADHVLADLATPRRHTMLGTIIPAAGEVAQLAATDYQGRWYLQDANHGAPIGTVVELVGMTLHADGTNGWSVDATTHDLGGAELLPPDYVPLSEDRDAAQDAGLITSGSRLRTSMPRSRGRRTRRYQEGSRSRPAPIRRRSRRTRTARCATARRPPDRIRSRCTSRATAGS